MHKSGLWTIHQCATATNPQFVFSFTGRVFRSFLFPELFAVFSATRSAHLVSTNVLQIMFSEMSRKSCSLPHASYEHRCIAAMHYITRGQANALTPQAHLK